MVEISQFVGKKVIIHLRESALSNFIKDTFQGEKTVIVEIAGIDFLGLWLAIPDVILVKFRDDKGKVIPEKERTSETAIEHFLLKWDYIDSISAFPEKEEEIVYYKKEIGFNRKE